MAHRPNQTKANALTCLFFCSPQPVTSGGCCLNQTCTEMLTALVTPLWSAMGESFYWNLFLDQNTLDRCFVQRKSSFKSSFMIINCVIAMTV